MPTDLTPAGRALWSSCAAGGRSYVSDNPSAAYNPKLFKIGAPEVKILHLPLIHKMINIEEQKI